MRVQKLSRLATPPSWSRNALLLLCAAAILAVPIGDTSASADLPSTAITYGYDDLGRLIEAANPSGSAFVYRWDKVGNLLSLQSQSSATVSIVQLAPTSAPVGEVVRIYGTNFSTTPSQDSVAFNGTAASVSSATPTELIVTVPSGATSGTVSVTTPSGAASSSESFTVAVSQAPTITSVSPTVLSAGSALTVNGTNFDANPANDVVGINQGATDATSASTSSVEATVPSETGSGQLTLETPYGVASGPDVFVPPSEYESSSVVQTTRMSLGAIGSNTTQEVTIGTAHGVAIVIFDAQAGQRVFVNLTNASLSLCTVALYEPRNQKIASTSSCGASGYIDTQTLPRSGTYTLLVAASGSSTGSLTLNLRNVPADVSGTIPTDGSSQTVTIGTPGQNGALTFSGSEGQRAFLNVASCTPCSSPYVEVSILKPDGSTVASKLISSAAGGYIDTQTLPSTGTYTVFVDPKGVTTPTVTLKLYNVPADVSGTIPTDGSAQTVAIGTPGQNGALTFSGSEGQRAFLNVASCTPCSSPYVEVSILKPDGSTVASKLISSAAGGYIDTQTLPSTGTYTVFVDPKGVTTPTVALNLYNVPADVSGAISTDGTTKTVTNTTPGQNGALTFSGSEGQRVFLNIPGCSPCASPYVEVSILKPDGSTLASKLISSTSGGYIDTQALPSSGTYTVLVDPKGALTTTITLNLYNVPADVSGTIPTDGTTKTVTISTPGQNGASTFSGSEGQRVFLNVASCTPCSSPYVEVSILKPDGSTLASKAIVSTAGGYIDTQTLPSTGTYTVLVDPKGATTPTVTLKLYNVPADVSGTIPTDGTTKTVTISTPGQNGASTFSGSEGQRVFLNVASCTPCSSPYVEVSILKPDGSTLASKAIVSTAGGYIDTQTLPSTGTYTVLVDPKGATTPTVTLNLYNVPADVSGAIEIGGSAVTLTTTTPGQNASLTFSGPASKGIHLKVANDTIGSGCCATKASIKKPDGTTLVSPTNIASGTTITATLGPAGTYAIVVDPQATATGSVALTLTDPPAAAGLLVRVDAPFGPAYTDPLVASSPGVFAPLKRGLSSRTTRRPRARSAAVRRRERGPRRTRTHRARWRHRAVQLTRHVRLPQTIDGRPTSVHAGTGPRPRSLRSATASWAPTGVNFKGDWTTHRASSSWESMPQLRAASSTSTALAGQALKLDGTPLAGVTVSIEDTNVTARTDRTGRFLLSGLPTGGRVLVIDGSSADNADASYGRFEVRVDLQAGVTTELGYPIWMPTLDEKHIFRLKSPTIVGTTLKTPDIPGLQIRIPAGTVITDSAGKRVRELTITAVPVDRPPFPLPLGSQIPLYFTVQPGGAYLSKGAQIVYPNYSRLPPGQRVPFWNYDPDKRGWYTYGQGTVTHDARHIVPDAGVRIWEFSGAMISGSPLPPEPWNPRCWIEVCEGGDPVQFNSGLFVMNKTDLALPDVMPLTLTRTYRPDDNHSYAFGIGMTDSYDMRLWSNQNYVTAELILPDGSRIHYVRTTPGTSFSDAAYRATETPSTYYGSTITRYQGWRLTLRDGTIYQFGYDSAGLQWIRDRFGDQVTIDRGSANALEKITSPNGRWIKFAHDAHNRITEAEDNIGRTVGYGYDASGRLTTVKDPAGGVTTYGYDSNNDMTSITDPRGITYLTNHYDASGRIEEQKLADGSAYHFSFTVDPETGKATKSTMSDPNGNITQASFNHDGFPTSVTDAAGTPVAQTSSYGAQTGTDFLTSITDPLGRVTSYNYDSNGNVSGITRLAGTEGARSTTFTHDPTFSQLTGVTDPLGHTTNLGYDSTGELTSVTDPLHDTWTAVYDNGAGQPTAITDPLGNTTTYSYRFGEPVATTDPLGRTTRRFFDAGGRELSTTTPLGDRTLFGYDPFNDLTGVTEPGGGHTTLSYDADGNLVSLTDAGAHKSSSTYDAMNRVSSTTDGLGKSDSYSYDGDGNLTSHVDRKGQTTNYAYDALNRLTFTGFNEKPGPSYESTVSDSYDAGNRLTQAQDSSCGTFSRSWDPFDELTEEAGPQGAISYSYDAAGRRTKTAVAGQPEVSYSYDNADRLSAITGAGSVGFGHDAAGRVTSTTLPDGISENYGFDNASELTGIQYKLGGTTLGDLNYAYDPAGDRSAVWGTFARLGEPAAFAGATYNADNELTSANGQAYEYDPNGNLTSDGQSAYTWNGRNQLTAISGSSGSASFGYDPFGRREQSTIHGTTTSYLHDGANVIQDLSGGSAQTSYLLGLGLDQRYGRSDSNGMQSYLTDALGSTLALADSSGNLKTSYTYDPFGSSAATGESSSNPYQYTGRENDGTGLQYNRARYYSPRQQRFVSQDPLGFSGSGPNLYSYALDNPMDVTDPTGEGGLLGGLEEVGRCVFGGAKKKVKCIIFVKERIREWWEEHVPQCKPNEVPIGGQCHGKGPEPPSIPPPPRPVGPPLPG